ncbi:tyrosine-type recombinase/integrase [Paraburkholderia terrae]|uniref:tyrosine-type recombinase/integrase n=1 Tax=Paraburkholderia terrae TaxID=311230 RepID=UPI00296B22D5|nr:tyrosine-type recombinase/integrase [Paraburkholderia terrae]MDW3660430.1 tyrosine-type recombinase/integrase [Paraburkholderia terrae]
MSPADWIDVGALPARRLPPTVDAALAWLGEALGHPVYRRWTLTDLKRAAPSLADAKRAHPAVFALLLDHDVAIEYWAQGRLHLADEAAAPSADAVLTRVLRAHQRRFRYLPAVSAAATARGEESDRALVPSDTDATGITDAISLIMSDASDPAILRVWLARAGRFMNASTTNSLGVADDARALAIFLRDRAHRSLHTLRAYRTELRRLIGWCHACRRGPLSDLTRDDLLVYRQSLDRTGRAHHIGSATPSVARGSTAGHQMGSDAGRRRALAVISSLYRYWQKTGYLVINPAADLSSGAAARAAWTPVRILPARLLQLCDAVVADNSPPDVSPLAWARRRAIWSLYRFAGVRLAELEWSAEQGLPRVSIDPDGYRAGSPSGSDNGWTLHVLGKGGKVRTIPLPSRCEPVLRDYRLARGLPAVPTLFETVPLIHSEKRDALGHSGLYDEVKAVLRAAEARLPAGDAATRALIHAASTHWLRHGYARTLVVDHAVPLPVAQTLLGHASVQTTAAYARTDLGQLREFVENSFSTDHNDEQPGRKGFNNAPDVCRESGQEGRSKGETERAK